jgi:subtilase family serine protease
VTSWMRRPARQHGPDQHGPDQHWPGEPRPWHRRRLPAVIGLAAVVAAGAALAATGALASGSNGGRNTAGSGPVPGQAPVQGGTAGTPSPAAPGGGLTPAQIRAAYGLPSLTDLNRPGPLKGITGKGQTIVIVDSFGSPTIAKDLARFDRYFRLPAPPSFRVIQPAGKPPPYHAGNSNRSGWAAETTLDVEWSHVIAPGARIVLVETPTSENEGTTGFPQIVSAEKYVLRHKLGQVISQSFAATEQTFSAKSDYAAIRNLRSAYQLAAADHVTVLAATGDQGATSDKYNMVDEYTSPAVSWPATDPLVTAVGGTQLRLRRNGTRLSPDVAWNDSGGGRSIVFPRPSYQTSVQSMTGSHRGVPDISMDASCRSSVAIYGSFDGAGNEPWSTLCGTSLATPLFAGIVALADQYAGHPLGTINPAIYRIEARHERGIVDITKGNNTQTFTQGGRRYTVHGFSARKGYDLVTGVGTVDAAYFVPELATS